MLSTMDPKNHKILSQNFDDEIESFSLQSDKFVSENSEQEDIFKISQLIRHTSRKEVQKSTIKHDVLYADWALRLSMFDVQNVKLA